ncbi:FHA domain-containing protein [Candidatus Poribacteria bacterium]|nr:FHA domain-containing protein [Candidatus Poribacteria bacterium]
MKAPEINRAHRAKEPVSGKFVIEVMNGPEDGRTTVCDQMPITIGRATDNAVHLPYDHLISRHHARLVEAEGKMMVCDLKSTNGTFVGSRRVHGKIVIERGKLFRVGATLLCMRSGEAESTDK